MTSTRACVYQFRHPDNLRTIGVGGRTRTCKPRGRLAHFQSQIEPKLRSSNLLLLAPEEPAKNLLADGDIGDVQRVGLLTGELDRLLELLDLSHDRRARRCL